MRACAGTKPIRRRGRTGGGRCVARLAVLAVLLLAVAAPHLRAEDEGRVTTVDPRRTGDLVVCNLSTDNLLGSKLLQSMKSGMVSQIDLDLALLDGDEEPVAGNRLSLRLAFDLWEEVFTVSSAGLQQRFVEQAGLTGFLRELKNVPVAPLEELAPRQRYCVRVGVRLYPVAPSQRDEIEAAIAGQPPRHREGENAQETSVSMGRLIRFFYTSDDEAEHHIRSRWFRKEELARAQD